MVFCDDVRKHFLSRRSLSAAHNVGGGCDLDGEVNMVINTPYGVTWSAQIC